MEEFGCWHEAQRCDLIAVHLLRLRDELRLDFEDSVTPLVRAVDQTSRLLRDIHDLFSIYRTRASLVRHDLTVILPCLSKTLRDMNTYVGSELLPAGRQWILMNERLNAQGGMTLGARFAMYYDFLVQLIRLLSSYALAHRSQVPNYTASPVIKQARNLLPL